MVYLVSTSYNDKNPYLFKEAAEYQGKKVPTGKIMKGDVKKFKVYVINPKTKKVKKVNFGHGGSSARAKGEKTLSIKRNKPNRQKSFLARHNCDSKKDKTSAGYWSCRAWRRGTKLP
jgi:hypothetical protein